MLYIFQKLPRASNVIFFFSLPSSSPDESAPKEVSRVSNVNIIFFLLQYRKYVLFAYFISALTR